MISSLDELLTELYNVRTMAIENPETAVVGTTAVKILNNNPRRVSAIITNLSANIMYIGMYPDVSSAKGWYLAPNGGTMTLKYESDFSLTAYAFFAISTVAGSNIFVLENVIY